MRAMLLPLAAIEAPTGLPRPRCSGCSPVPADDSNAGQGLVSPCLLLLGRHGASNALFPGPTRRLQAPLG